MVGMSEIIHYGDSLEKCVNVESHREGELMKGEMSGILLPAPNILVASNVLYTREPQSLRRRQEEVHPFIHSCPPMLLLLVFIYSAGQFNMLS